MRPSEKLVKRGRPCEGQGSTLRKRKMIKTVAQSLEPVGEVILCSICDEKFYEPLYLNWHVRNEHKEEVLRILRTQRPAPSPQSGDITIPLVVAAAAPSSPAIAPYSANEKSMGEKQRRRAVLTFTDEKVPFGGPMKKIPQRTSKVCTCNRNGLRNDSGTLLRKPPTNVKKVHMFSNCSRPASKKSGSYGKRRKFPAQISKNPQETEKRSIKLEKNLEEGHNVPTAIPVKVEEITEIIQQETLQDFNDSQADQPVPQVAEPYSCFICKYTSSTAWSMMQHVRKNHEKNKGPFRCNNCTFECGNVIDFVRHRCRKCKEVTDFSCSFCPRDFGTLHSKEIHEIRHKTGTKDACECPQCGVVFFRRPLLMKHIQTEHQQ